MHFGYQYKQKINKIIFQYTLFNSYVASREENKGKLKLDHYKPINAFALSNTAEIFHLLYQFTWTVITL